MTDKFLCPICGKPYTAIINDNYNSKYVGMFVHYEKWLPNVLNLPYLEDIKGCVTRGTYLMREYDR